MRWLGVRGSNGGGGKEGVASLGDALHLPVFELDRREPAENGNGNLELAPVGIDLVDAAREVGEGTVGDLDLFAHGVLDLRHFLAAGGLPHLGRLVITASDNPLAVGRALADPARDRTQRATGETLVATSNKAIGSYRKQKPTGEAGLSEPATSE